MARAAFGHDAFFRNGDTPGRGQSRSAERKVSQLSDQTPSPSDWVSPSIETDVAEAAVYVISVAADLAGMHPQTLRQYDRLGLVTPSRTRGRGRRYSRRDIALLREIQKLSQEEGINLAGISRILELENDVERLKRENHQLRSILASIQERKNRVWAADSSGVAQAFQRGNRPRHDTDSRALVVRRAGSVVLWEPSQR